MMIGGGESRSGGRDGRRMQLHGTVEANLIAAVNSAKRLRGQRVYAETVAHWTRLIEHARSHAHIEPGRDSAAVRLLVAELETEIRGRAG